MEIRKREWTEAELLANIRMVKDKKEVLAELALSTKEADKELESWKKKYEGLKA